MGIRGHHIARDAVWTEHIPSGEIRYDDLRGVMIGTITVDPPSIGAGLSAYIDITVSGLKTEHKVVAMCQDALEPGLVPQAALVPAANTLRIRLYNPTGASIDGAPRPWFFIAWIP